MNNCTIRIVKCGMNEELTDSFALLFWSLQPTLDGAYSVSVSQKGEDFNTSIHTVIVLT